MRLEHRVNDKIDIMIVEPLGFVQNTLLDEAETFGNGAASDIAYGAVQNDSVAALLPESVMREAGRGSCHDSTALVGSIEPIAQFGSSIHGVEVVLADDAGQYTIIDNDKGEATVISGLFERPADESGGVVDPVAVVQPRQPRSQVGAIAVDECADLFCICRRSGFHFHGA